MGVGVNLVQLRLLLGTASVRVNLVHEDQCKMLLDAGCLFRGDWRGLGAELEKALQPEAKVATGHASTGVKSR